MYEMKVTPKGGVLLHNKTIQRPFRGGEARDQVGRCCGGKTYRRLFQSALADVDGSSNSWNATSTTASQSSQRKNPASVSTVAGAVWQASHTLHRVHIAKLGHK